MKISKSKKELARIISENGGWIEWKGGECPVDGDREVSIRVRGESGSARGKAEHWSWGHSGCGSDIIAYRLHKPEQAKSTAIGDYETNIAAKEELEAMEYKPSIEQLASDYRNRKGYADRKQQEADAAKADAEAKLGELIAAGKELGLVPVSVVKPAIDGCMQLVDMVPTRLQIHQEESVAAIGHVVNVERLYDKVRDVFDLLK